MSIYRLTGVAGRVVSRSVQGKQAGEDGTVPSYTFRSQEVEVAPLIVTRIDLEDDDAGLVPGEHVDVAVEVTVSRGYLRSVLRGSWPEQESASASHRPHAVVAS
jgi:hypothetical protein